MEGMAGTGITDRRASGQRVEWESGMTEREWLASEDVDAMVQRARRSGTASTRKRLLFAAACLRRLWPILQYEGSQEAIEVLERFADGEASEEERLAAVSRAGKAARAAQRDLDNAEPYSSGYAAIAATSTAALAVRIAIENQGPNLSTVEAASLAHQAQAYWESDQWKRARAAQATLLRDIFGLLPFRLMAPLNPGLLAWNGGTVPNLARAIYDDRAFDHLPVLADALEEAGCTDADVLSHCRRPGDHVRGCWIVDLLLGKS
jgi:hypothetical protein